MPVEFRTVTRFGAGLTPLVALCDGPTSEGSGDPFAVVWGLWVDIPQYQLHFARLSDNYGAENSDPPSQLSDVAARDIAWLSASFDQNARRVVAWKVSSGQITLSYIPTGVSNVDVRVNWFGHEPLLFWDAALLGTGGDTDILCFYVSLDRSKLCYRIQSEIYATEHVYLELPVQMALDTIKLANNSLSLVLHDANNTFFETETAPYPILSSDASKVFARHTGGLALEKVIVRDPHIGAFDLAARNTSGRFAPLIVIPDGVLEAIQLAFRHTSGSYRLQGQAFDAIDAPMFLTPRGKGGAYISVFVSSGDIIAPETTIRVRHVGGLAFERTVQRDSLGEVIGFSSRNVAGAFREVGQFFDPVFEESYFTARAKDGAFTLRVTNPQDVPTDTTLVAGRHTSGRAFEAVKLGDAGNDSSNFYARNSGGLLGESDRVTRQSETSSLFARSSSGALVQQNTVLAGDAISGLSAMYARNTGGEYKLAPSNWWITTSQTPFVSPTSDSEWMYVWGAWE